MNRIQTAAAAVVAALPLSGAVAQIKAFPEAEGFGRFATGARTNLGAASVYHVTNLNDSGTGSFRDAVSQPNRFVVFDVSGVLNAASTIVVSPNITIAGQTAPGGGFTVYGSRLAYTGADNTITRYLRVRKGTTTGRDDSVSLAAGTNMMFDHMSVTWGNDETFSLNPSTGATINNITIQNTIIGQGLDNVNHSAGGLFQPNGSLSVLRNLFIDNETRNPKAKGNVQFVNNVVYNWTTAAYIAGGDSDGNHYANMQGNYFIQGPQNGGSPISGANGDYHLFADDNFYDSNRNGVLDGADLSQAAYGPVDWLSSPLAQPTVNIETPADAYARITAQVGPSLYRDEVDTRLIDELTSLGTLGQIVVDETDLFPSYPGNLPSPPRPTDTDNDAIPDSWETAHGLNPADGNDWKNIGLTGYTRLEEYINEIASDHPDKVWNASSGTWPTSPTWAGGTPTWDDEAFVTGQGAGTPGAVTISSPGASAFRLFIGGNGDAALGETVTVNAGGALAVMDTIQVGYQNTATLAINAGGTVEATAIILGNGSLLNGANQSGNLVVNGGTLRTGIIASAGGGGTFQMNGGTLQPNANGTFAAAASISGAVNFDSNNYTSTFSGAISGAGSINKVGSGVMNLTGNNTFTGGIFLKNGALGASSDANLGGAASAITFQGGTLRINGTSLTNIDGHDVNWSSFNGGIDVNSAAHTFTINSNISGPGQLIKDGAGILQLNGNNTHSGGTVLRGGKLAITNSSNIGGPARPITFQGGTLRILGTTLANLDAHIVNWNGFNGGFDIADASHTFTINQNIAGSGGLIKDGAGTLVLNAANTFTGNTVINAGVLKMGHPLALQFSTLNFPTGGGTLDLNGFSLNIGGIAGGGGFDLKGGTLTVGSNNLSTTFSGVISDSVGGGQLLKVGSGNLTLTGSTATAINIVSAGGGIGFSGNVPGSGASPFGTLNAGVILNGGKLARTSSGGAAWDRLFTIGPAGGTLEGSTGYVKLNSTGTVPFSSTGNTTLTLSGSQADNEFKFRLVDPVGGKLTLNKNGSGRWIVSPASAMTYGGDTNISSGIFLLNSGDNVMPFGAGKGNINISSGAQFELNGRSVTINGLNGAGNLNQRNATTETLNLGNGDANGSFSGTITDTGTINLIKSGTGIQILSGNNTYAGTTVINGGVLQFNAANSIGGSGASVTVGSLGTAAAGFAMNQAFLARIAPASSGAVALAVNSANALDFTGLNASLASIGSTSYTGLITPNAATYRLGGGGTLVIPNTNVLSGARNIQVVAGGTVRIGGANTLTGATTINAGGRLQVGHATSLGGGSMNVDGSIELLGTFTQPFIATTMNVNDSTGSVQLNGNSAIINYSGASPLSDVRADVSAGRIATSFSQSDSRIAVGYAEASTIGAGSFGGVALDGTAVLLRPTLKGDADLNAIVNITDFAQLAANFNITGTSAVWSAGNFNHDNAIDISDFALLAANFNQTTPVLTPRPAAVPEPMSIAIVGVAGLLARRRRA